MIWTHLVDLLWQIEYLAQHCRIYPESQCRAGVTGEIARLREEADAVARLTVDIVLSEE
jgi:hypothetical protein